VRRAKQVKIGHQILEAQEVYAHHLERTAMRAYTEMLTKGGSWAQCFANNVMPALQECQRDPEFARRLGKAARTIEEHAPGLHRFMGAVAIDSMRRGRHPEDIDLASEDVWFGYLDAVFDAQTKGTGPLAAIPEVLAKRP
jgi:hypothetical protein